MSYDIIGDIHGYSETLERLLTELGYKRDADDVYCHPDRNVIFLGDFIDRGPYQREVISSTSLSRRTISIRCFP